VEEQTSHGSPYSEEAFRRFYDDTLREAFGVARRVCGRDDDAIEACQDAYVAVYRYWSSSRLKEPPQRLLFRAVQRSATDALRARLRRERHLSHAEPGGPALGTIGGPLERALRSMRLEDASLLVLQAVVGISYEELARVQGTSVGAIRSRLFRARRELSRRYEAEGGEW
jgi:RNA polymerase sigma-70 factor (ECF subfamily)